MFQEITRPFTTEEVRALRSPRRWLANFAGVAGCLIVLALAASAVTAVLVTALTLLTSTIPPERTILSYTWIAFGGTFGVLAALAIVLAVLGTSIATLVRAVRGSHRSLTTVETLASWDAAIAFKNPPSDEHEVVFLRVEPDTVWIAWFIDLPVSDAVDYPAGVRIVGGVGETWDERRVPLAKIEPSEEIMDAIISRSNQRVAIGTLPEPVQAAFRRL